MRAARPLVMAPLIDSGPMRRVRMSIEFDGSAFSGWQRQGFGERTVQGVLEEALGRLPGAHGPVHGAGRTDAGVHALAMVAHVDTSGDLPDKNLRFALNAHLPRDVIVWDVETVPAEFESRFDCRYRRYIYRMRPVRQDARGMALDRLRILPLFRDVDVAAMQEAATAVVGKHDFSSFATQETRTRDRTVHLCELRREDSELRLHIAADGFLRNMVRTVVGTLLWVGKGRLAAGDMTRVIEARDRAMAGPNVAPHGLYFAEAGYAAWDPARSEAWIAALRV